MKEIAKAYKKEKGVEVKIVTAASNTYEEKLKSEMSKEPRSDPVPGERPHRS